jgi:beta-lactamase superfamily II metal-dependent hydrolase
MTRALLLMLLLLTACTPTAQPRPDAPAAEQYLPDDQPALKGAATAVQLTNAVTLYTFDVGQGLCQLVVYPAPNGQRPDAVLIDCGSTKAPYNETLDDVAQTIRGFLAQVNLLGVVVSHMDRDHCNLIPRVLPDTEGALVILGDDPQRVACTLDFSNWLGEQAWETWAAGQFNAAGAPYAPFTRNNVSFFFMGGGWNPNTPSNEHSLVTGIHYNNGKIVLTGDMTGATATTIRGRYAAGFLANVGVMGVPHHGGVVPPGEVAAIQAWVAATRPNTINFSSAYTSGNSHPRCATANLYNTSLGQTEQHYFSCANSADNYVTQQTRVRALGTCNLGLITTNVSGTNVVTLASSANAVCQD